MTPTPFQKLLAGYVLKALAQAHQEGRKSGLDDLVSEVKARRVDVRATLSRLHHEGYVDAVTMRLTMKGFVVGSKLAEVELRPLRARPALRVVKAA